MPRKKRTTRTSLASLLLGGDRRSLGRANSVVDLVLGAPARFPELLKLLWSDDEVLRMRAADAAEKISQQKPGLLQPYKAELLGLAGESTQQEVRWHLALMLPRLRLTGAERQRAVARLKEYLADRSSIVKTMALQGLSEIAAHDPNLHAEVSNLLEHATRSGTPAMKARARKLLLRVHG